MSDLDGYVTDIPYVRGFKPMLAPAWLDHVALLWGLEPPRRDGGFAWCDLGCGQGVTAAVLAATHPGGIFHGVDAMDLHVDHARRLKQEAAVANLRFHPADFAAAAELALPPFDYIVAHGVYTWVEEPARAALRRFIDRRLKPDGLVYVSYNALPGWTVDLPFQRLVRDLGMTLAGDSAARFAAAATVIGRLAQARVPALADSYIVRELDERPDDYPAGYLVHEFMHAGWQPLYVTDMRAAMATIGLKPVGSATLIENFDRWVLGSEARATLAAIADPDVRELARDFWIDQRFRCDVFTRDARSLTAKEQRRRLLASTFALVRPAAAVAFSATTPAGRLDYDNRAARAIVTALDSGPRVLAAIAADGIARQDLLANALALCAAGELRPVEPGRAPVAALNRALCRRLGGPEEILVLALPCGTALEIGADLGGLLRDGSAVDRGKFGGWREFLTSHGI